MFSNRNVSPKLFHNLLELEDFPNQVDYRYNFLQEALKEQHKMNEQIAESYTVMENLLSNSFSDVNNRINHTSVKQNMQFDSLYKKLEKQEAIIQLLVEKIENESLINQAILDQVSVQHRSTEQLTGKMNQFELLSEDMSTQLNKQHTQYNDISKQLEVQEIYHTTMMNRLDEQEAITQKIIRQLDHLRASLFERIDFLSQKFESIVKPVQSYFVKKEDQKVNK
ncbi:tryptophan 2,3-dioxygenase [Cytobacillus eiseniae]|uniref:Tryptophan 2,3-dioxygenase n=1 Tax=Cytobacillus eiseniae TaxID=762947 RepID=A0ABS4RA62_9BACI|nr:hypothetical protein [Cytobacillus eiseniae]MBP2239788.1 tryptophan 2,3-dioxygenase [Cytobacillus eiseniae]